MSPYSPTPDGIAFDEVRPGFRGMSREPSGQPPHLGDHCGVLPLHEGNDPAGWEPALDNLGQVPGAEKLGDVAVNRGEAMVETPLNSLVQSAKRRAWRS